MPLQSKEQLEKCDKYKGSALRGPGRNTRVEGVKAFRRDRKKEEAAMGCEGQGKSAGSHLCAEFHSLEDPTPLQCISSKLAADLHSLRQKDVSSSWSCGVEVPICWLLAPSLGPAPPSPVEGLQNMIDKQGNHHQHPVFFINQK